MPARKEEIENAKEEIKGKDFSLLFANAGPEESYHAQLAQNRCLESEFELVRRDGQVIPVWAKMVTLHATNGDFTRAVIYLRELPPTP